MDCVVEKTNPDVDVLPLARRLGRPGVTHDLMSTLDTNIAFWYIPGSDLKRKKKDQLITKNTDLVTSFIFFRPKADSGEVGYGGKELSRGPIVNYTLYDLGRIEHDACFNGTHTNDVVASDLVGAWRNHP
ncbi:hypothetical protein BgiBS90_028607 [Biomphalaria glabrata]|nr:hypothetical protein BgiBS90_028607 [Biomphalaria glabrata]